MALAMPRKGFNKTRPLATHQLPKVVGAARSASRVRGEAFSLRRRFSQCSTADRSRSARARNSHPVKT